MYRYEIPLEIDKIDSNTFSLNIDSPNKLPNQTEIKEPREKKRDGCCFCGIFGR